MTQENLRYCLDQMSDEFSTEQFTKCLKNNKQEQVTSKYAYQALKSLEKKNLIIKNGKAMYKKLLPTNVDPLYITTEFMNKCKDENKVSFWEYGGLFSTSAQFVLLGIPKNKKFPEWKVKLLEILLSRQAELYKAIESLMIYEHKSPSLMSEASRQVILELIPYWLGHKAGEDNDGLNAHDLLQETRRLEGIIQHNNGQAEVEEYLSMFEQSMKDEAYDENWPKKIADKLVMITIPNDWTLDDRYDERRLVRYLTKAIKMKLSTELIMFELANFWAHEIINKTLDQLEYLSNSKIDDVRNYYNKFALGRKVLPYLDDIEYCQRTIERLNEGDLRPGWYGDALDFEVKNEDERLNRFESGELHKKDIYLGTNKPEYTYYDDGFDEKSKIPGRLRNRLSTFYEIKSKPHYEKILTERVEALRELVKGHEIDKALEAAGFNRAYKLPQDSHYLWEGVKISAGLAKCGIIIEDEQIEASFRDGLQEGEQFIKKAIKSRGRWTINS